MTIISTGAYDFPAAADRNRNSMLLQPQIGPWDSNGQPTSPLSVMDGVHSGLKISKTTGMGFQIEPGRAAVNGATAADGTFTCAITAPEAGAFEPNASAYDRSDVVILRAYPENPATSGVVLEVVKGEEVPHQYGPPVPPRPAGSLELYQVVIPAGTSAANGGWNTTKVYDLRTPIGVPKFLDYTPSWGNFQNLGSGFKSKGRYRLDGDKVSLHAQLEAGDGALMGSSHLLHFNLPIPSKDGYVYYGTGGLRTGPGGLAYDLRILSGGGVAMLHAIDGNGALMAPGGKGYPFGKGTIINVNLEYFVDL